MTFMKRAIPHHSGARQAMYSNAIEYSFPDVSLRSPAMTARL
jgi:hypothetical protein